MTELSNETFNYRVLLVFAPLLILTGAAGARGKLERVLKVTDFE